MKSRGKKFRSIVGGLRALPKIFRPHPGVNKTSKPARGESSSESLIFAVFEATGYRMNEQQAEKLRASLRGFAHGGPASPTQDPQRERESKRGPAAARAGSTGAAPYDRESSSPAAGQTLKRFLLWLDRAPEQIVEGQPSSSGSGEPDRRGLDPGIVATPSSLRDEVMSGARELQRELNRQEPSLSRPEMVELLLLVHRLGQLFFEQGQDKVTHGQLQNEIANLKHLIESKGK